MKKIILGVFVFLALVFVFTPVVKASTLDDIMLQITNLQKQVAELQQKISASVINSVSPSTSVGVNNTTATVANFIFTKNLSFKMNNNDVLELQKVLVKNGLLTSDNATGYFGDKTLTAVKSYQRQNNLPVTGNVDLGTIRSLNKSSMGIACTSSSVKGDVNNDGAINAIDGLLVNKIVGGMSSVPTEKCCVDVDGDGSVTSTDYTYIANYFVGSTPIGSTGQSCTQAKASPSVVSCSSTSKIGDANGDGAINSIDALLVNKIVAGMSQAPTNKCCVDTNGDSLINATDYTYIANYFTGVTPTGLIGQSCTLAPAPAVATCSSNSKIGDANADGAINAVDALLINKIASGMSSAPTNKCCVDVDGNGSVTTTDAIYAGNYFVNTTPFGLAGQMCR